MTRREFLKEQYEDALFALLMDDLAVTEGEKALEEYERLKNDPQVVVPDQVVQRGLRTIRKYFSRQNTVTVRRVTAKAISRVAVVALVGMLLFTTAFAASTDFRISTINYIIDVFDDHAVFTSENVEANKKQIVCAGWLPENYEQVSYEDTGEYVKVLFKKPNGQSIVVEMNSANEKLSVDTESAELGTVLVNGYEAVTIVKRGIDGYGNSYERSSIIWVDILRGVYISIRSNDENVDVLLRVANQIILK